MFRRKKREKEKVLVGKMAKSLDKAAKRAVNDAKQTQRVILANGFTLELLAMMGGKHD